MPWLALYWPIIFISSTGIAEWQQTAALIWDVKLAVDTYLVAKKHSTDSYAYDYIAVLYSCILIYIYIVIFIGNKI